MYALLGVLGITTLFFIVMYLVTASDLQRLTNLYNHKRF
jgi:hypothetical protein